MRGFYEIDSQTLEVSPGNFIYSVVLVSQAHKGGEERLFVVASSDDSLTYVSLSTQPKISAQIVRGEKKAHKGLTCLQRFHDESHESDLIVTSGADGTVKVWHGSQSKIVRQLATPKSEPISAIACQPDLGLIAAGTDTDAEKAGDVAVYIWKLETEGAAPIRAFTEIHSNSITAMLFHPRKPSHLVTASTDSLINVVDAELANEDDAVIATVVHDAPVHHIATFAHPAGSSIGVCAVSHDERLGCYELDDEGFAAMHGLKADVRALLGVDYTVWARRMPDGSGVWLCASANKQETAEKPFAAIASFNPDAGGRVTAECRLEGAHGEEVVRGVWWGDSVMLSAGEDGCLRVWEELGGQQRESGVQRKDRKKAAGERFKPY